MGIQVKRFSNGECEQQRRTNKQPTGSNNSSKLEEQEGGK